MPWNSETTLNSVKYKCGYCGNLVATNKGFQNEYGDAAIYICPHCDKPTYINRAKVQIPGVATGNDVRNLPSDLEALYREARNCVTVQSNTACVLLCRKLMMNISVAQGAEAGKSFISYVEYLAEKGYVPPNGRGWVDHIRKKGNEATHEIALMSQADAEELITFVEMLLKFIYEFPARIPAQ